MKVLNYQERRGDGTWCRVVSMIFYAHCFEWGSFPDSLTNGLCNVESVAFGCSAHSVQSWQYINGIAYQYWHESVEETLQS